MSIELRDVHKAFGDRAILEGVSLTVEEGETLAVIGYSGVGKSVLLKSIVRLLEPDAGSVHVDDTDVLALEREPLNDMRRRIGYVFQFAALFDSMTVFDNVAMGLRRAGMALAEIPGRVQESLALVEMEGYDDRLPAQLSGGQRKRVGLARAIATRPKYLLYDEPTTGLDPVTTTVIDQLIQKMARELGVTSVVVTHDMKSAYRIANRIALLYRGRIRYSGTAAEIQAAADPVVRGFIEGRPELLQEAVA
ncbi:MAG TPA: ATP-binding cassette domain-containing protein [Longimicrobiales bacterium]|nr:ATP-binding cassette domain-containing protein [Longimicrobiales bacterium]